MAKRVTNEDIQKINEVYSLCRNINKTSELTGWSTSTVRKYLIKDFKYEPKEAAEFHIDFPPIKDAIKSLKEGENILSLTENEKHDLDLIRKRMIV